MCKALRIFTAVLMALLLLLSAGCASSGSSVLAAPTYPKMSAYPSDTFSDKSFAAWREDRNAQRNQPEGYADNLASFFSQSIPIFLETDAENPVCSPLNLYMALSLLAESTGGTSRQQILDTLEARSIEALRTQARQVWNSHYCADGANASLLANSLWLSDSLSYRQETVNILAQHYFASVFQGDLGSPEMNAALRGWLNEQTGGLLEEQAQNVQMNPQTAIALASTILFRAKWTSEFSEERNTEAIFHAPSGDQTVTYMNKLMPYGPYYWGADFAAVSLSLEDGSRMWLILPDEGKTPEDLLSSGLAIDLVLSPQTYSDQEAIQVNLSLPKFDVTADTRMEQALQKLGITAVFDPEAADFTAILPDGPAWLDQVQHAARVTIDEEGVSAAAYTVMMMAGAARPPEDEVDFVVDRPFLFVISSHDDLPLFAGIVNDPA